MKVSWGRKLGFCWGVTSGLPIGAAIATGTWWLALAAILPAIGALLFADNDWREDGSVSFGMND